MLAAAAGAVGDGERWVDILVALGNRSCAADADHIGTSCGPCRYRHPRMVSNGNRSGSRSARSRRTGERGSWRGTRPAGTPGSIPWPCWPWPSCCSNRRAMRHRRGFAPGLEFGAHSAEVVARGEAARESRVGRDAAGRRDSRRHVPTRRVAARRHAGIGIEQDVAPCRVIDTRDL